MNRRNKFYLLVCVALCVLLTQALMAQTPVTTQFSGTDGGGITIDLQLAVHPNGTYGRDSLNPTLYESTAGIPPPPQGFDLRVAKLAGFDSLDNYTSIHDLVYDTETDCWKIQFQRDAAQTGFDFSWAAGLAGVGAGYWKIVGDPNDADPIIAALDVDMTSTTMLHVNLADTDPHTFFIKKGDGALLRTFKPDEIADAADSKGKKGKAEKRKYYAAEACFTFTATDTVNDLHVEYNNAVLLHLSTDGTTEGSTEVFPKQKKWDYTGFTRNPGQTVTICVKTDKGKASDVKKWNWTKTGVSTGAGVIPVPSSSRRFLSKMPNINNIGEEAYVQIVWGETFNGKPAGIVVGTQNQAGVDIKLKPFYKFVHHPKWKDVTKTLLDKTGKHTGAAKCLDNFVNTKPILKGQKSLPPNKHNNILLAEALALAFNIGISDAGKTETDGFGDMVYVNQPGDPAGLPAGSTVRQIDVMLDSVLSCVSTRAGTYAEWDSVVHRLNCAGSGPFDTSNYDGPDGSKALGTEATGVVAMAELDYLYRTSLIAAPINIKALDLVALEATPEKYELSQNYPNPFNPTTTINFSLPEEAVVTLIVYNMLGQEVATLVENEQFDEGVNEVTFDASRMSSGVYYYRLIANNGSQQHQFVKKMMLVK